MGPDQWDRVQELLDRAVELNAGDRSKLLDAECADAPEVRAQVESLLSYHSADFLDRKQLDGLIDDQPAASHPEWIDGYRVTGILGEGGMGVVYKAEQDRHVRRTVAIKLIQLGMNSRQVVARFDTERQALALMNHRSIAGVYHAGVMEDGRPYFVMEHVQGVPITRYCDDHTLTIRQRLELFVQLCDGTQHAHQKGIIHRDIKPSNVLVAELDDGPAPKIIDFGVAKAIKARPAEATMLTELGQVVGTPWYMSPEQASAEGADVDTRSDVYSLGVLLFELLVGRLPFQVEGPAPALDEIRRRIREVDASRPSTGLQSLGDAAEEISRHRCADPASIRRQLRGDLDWIVLKALEKDPNRRYASASEFAADIRRHLADEPVSARPPGTLYRLGKFVRRHRVGVASAAVVLLALIAGIVLSSIGLVRATRAERDARQAQQLATDEAARANREAATSQAVVNNLVEIFDLADPEESRGRKLTAVEILDRQAKEIGTELDQEPGVRGQLMVAMAKAYRGLGLYRPSMQLLEDALQDLRQVHGDRSERVYDVLNELGNLANQVGDYEQARNFFQGALELAEELRGPSHRDVAVILKNLGDAYLRLGETDLARPALERALEIRTETFGPESATVAKTMSSLASLLVDIGDYDAAIPLARTSLEIRSSHYGPGSSGVAFGHYYLGEAQHEAGELEPALANLSAAAGIWEKRLGLEHERVGDTLLQLAHVLRKLGRSDEAYETYRRAVSIAEAAFDADDPTTAAALVGRLDDCVGLLRGIGRDAEADNLAARAEKIRDSGLF